MAQVTLDQIRNQIQTLDRDELSQLKQEIEAKLSPDDEAEKHKAVLQEMLAKGLIRRIARRRPDDNGQRAKITALGKPVSETILEDRG